jgi:hypothetical protein
MPSATFPLRDRRRLAPALQAAWLAPAVLVTLLGSAGCDVAFSGFREEETDTWTRSYPLSASGRVEIGNTNGFIEVTAGSGQNVDVKAVRVARAASKEAAKEMLSKTTIKEEVTTDLVKLTTQRPPGGWNHGGVEVRYTITVPASARVELQTTNGRIGVTNVTAGTKLGTTNGEIDGRGLSGAINASTTNGSVDLELASLSDDVRVSTTNGQVTVRVPADAKATISTRWTNGGVEMNGLTVEEVEKSRRRFDGRLNGGGARIDVETTNGGITLGKR